MNRTQKWEEELSSGSVGCCQSIVRGEWVWATLSDDLDISSTNGVVDGLSWPTYKSNAYCASVGLRAW